MLFLKHYFGSQTYGKWSTETFQISLLYGGINDWGLEMPIIMKSLRKTQKHETAKLYILETQNKTNFVVVTVHLTKKLTKSFVNLLLIRNLISIIKWLWDTTHKWCR